MDSRNANRNRSAVASFMKLVVRGRSASFG